MPNDWYEITLGTGVRILVTNGQTQIYRPHMAKVPDVKELWRITHTGPGCGERRHRS